MNRVMKLQWARQRSLREKLIHVPDRMRLGAIPMLVVADWVRDVTVVGSVEVTSLSGPYA
jgi:hypothetical protein